MDDQKPTEQDERVAAAYERILANVRDMLSSSTELTRKEFDRALQRAGTSLDQASEFTRNEINRAGDAIRKDWQNLMQAVNKQKDSLLQSEQFQRLADTSLGILGNLAKSIKDWAGTVDDKIDAQLSYHTGEIAGPGQFICTNCGQTLTFQKSGRIPPCGSCKNTTFRRKFS